MLLDENFEKNYFVKEAKKKFNSEGDQIYDTPDSAEWWNTLQVKIIKYQVYIVILTV